MHVLLAKLRWYEPGCQWSDVLGALRVQSGKLDWGISVNGGRGWGGGVDSEAAAIHLGFFRRHLC